MNNLTYQICKEFRSLGYHSDFIIDVHKNFLLDRPENWYVELKDSGYPDWVFEKPLYKYNSLLGFSLFPKLVFRNIIQFLNSYDVIFLNGNWVLLASFIKKKKLVIQIYAGFEIEQLGNTNSINYFLNNFYRSRIRKLAPRIIVQFLFKRWINKNREGIRRADVINYFPTGIIPESEVIINEIFRDKPFGRLELRGFDSSKFKFVKRIRKEKFVITSFTRFFYNNDRFDNKRNDLMIRGIADFINLNKGISNIEINFFEKGPDLEDAKKLCMELGISDFVKWHKEVDFEKLYHMSIDSDVTFDQLGSQWVGIGILSMLSGRPLIANGRPDIFEKLSHLKSPICQATTTEEVTKWLYLLYTDSRLAEIIGKQSSEYVNELYNFRKMINFYENEINSFYTT
jgi:glycosyltransferase involved in cell wall biosynthesis